jgi:hypothetical protein
VLDIHSNKGFIFEHENPLVSKRQLYASRHGRSFAHELQACEWWNIPDILSLNKDIERSAYRVRKLDDDRPDEARLFL